MVHAPLTLTLTIYHARSVMVDGGSTMVRGTLDRRSYRTHSIQVPDDQGPDGGLHGTWTRQQILEARYGDSTATTNGHAPTNKQASDLEVETPAARTCAGCSKPLSGRQQVWCSERCRRRHIKKGRTAISRSAPRPLRPVRAAPAVPQAADNPAAALEPPWAALAALADQLPQGWRLELAAGRAVFAWNKEN